MYNLLSGPITIAVGKLSPDTIVVLTPDGSIRITSPVAGVGNFKTIGSPSVLSFCFQYRSGSLKSSADKLAN